MRTFKHESAPVVTEYISVADKGEYKYYFGCIKGQVFISNEDIGAPGSLETEEQVDCLLSKEDSKLLVEYLQNNIGKDNTCVTSKTKSKR